MHKTQIDRAFSRAYKCDQNTDRQTHRPTSLSVDAMRPNNNNYNNRGLRKKRTEPSVTLSALSTPSLRHCAVEEHCNSPMYVGYRHARTGDFAVTIQSTASDVTSGLIDPTQALRGSRRRWQMPTNPLVTYTFAVRFMRPCAAGWRVERLWFTVEEIDSFRLAVGKHVVVREVRF